MFRRISFRPGAAFLSIMAGLVLAAPAKAGPMLLVDLATGQVLQAEQATRPWYPASLTKLMTVYVALDAVRSGRIALRTPLVVSSRAARMAPSKIGFRPGTEVTLENALKIIMVKSANDVSVTIAEGVSGSVEGFSAQMNATARALGMSQSHFVNPNGLHHPAHVSSARDMAILARALYLHFPNQQGLYGIDAIQLGRRVMRNTNGVIGRYPGANGMKTGYVCASGFNVVASATRHGRTLIAVVMGAPSGTVRTHMAMGMLDRGFGGSGSSGGYLQSLPRSHYASPPNMRSEICNGKRRRELIRQYVSGASRSVGASASGFRAYASAPETDSAAAFFAADKAGKFHDGDSDDTPITGLQLPRRVLGEPIRVYAGRAPGWTGPVARPVADDKPAVAQQDDSPAKSSAARLDTKAGEPLTLRGARKPLPKADTAKAARNPARKASASGRGPVRAQRAGARKRVERSARKPAPKAKRSAIRNKAAARGRSKRR